MEVLTDSLSLCNEAFMRSGLRGGGSGGSEAAMVGPEEVPFICIIYAAVKANELLKQYWKRT